MTTQTQRKPLSLPAPAVGKKRGPAIGERMPDGTVYAGTPCDTSRPLFVAAADLRETMVWFDAMRIAARTVLHGRADWRVPTSWELELLYHNRGVIGGFNESGFPSEGWYWTSVTPLFGLAWARRFRDGNSDTAGKLHLLSVRLVRG